MDKLFLTMATTFILAHPPYDTIDDPRMLWDYSQLIPMHEKP
jgi:hypothetical protein